MYSALKYFRSVVTSALGLSASFTIWDIISLFVEEKPIFFNRKKPLVVKKKTVLPPDACVVGRQVKKK